MKKTWFILLIMSCILGFTACSDEDDDSQPPLTEIVMNNMASIGDVFTISGSGFDKSSTQIYFRNKNEEFLVEDLEFTATGIQFKIPTELTPGKYSIVLKQNGTWALGEVTLIAMKNPISNIVYPTEIYIGQSMTIQGEGFKNTTKVYLEDIEGKRTEALNIINMANGLTCRVPSNLKSQAFYTIVFTQDGGEWKSEIKAVALLVKRLTSMMTPIAGYWEYTEWSDEEPWGPIDSMWIEPKQKITEFNYDEQGRVIEIVEYIKNEDQTTEEEETVTIDYNTENQIKIVFNNSMEYSSATFEVRNNQVITCTTLDAWEEESISYEWSYNDGYLTKITETSEQEPIWEFTYSDNNLKDIYTYGSNMPFEYGNKNAYGVNVPLMLTEDIFIKYAAYLGLTGKTSKNIPEKYYLIGSEEGINLDCTTDNDGYIIDLLLSTEDKARTFTYEVVQ